MNNPGSEISLSECCMLSFLVKGLGEDVYRATEGELRECRFCHQKWTLLEGTWVRMMRQEV